MDTVEIKNNSVPANSKKRKSLKIAVAVLCALSLLLIAFLTCKNTLFFHIAQRKALNDEYRDATAYASESTDPRAQLISDYAFLRVDINENYPDLLVEFDRDLLSDWYSTACRISESDEKLDSDCTTIGGWAAENIGAMPVAFDSFDYLQFTILVKHVDENHRISRLLILEHTYRPEDDE